MIKFFGKKFIESEVGGATYVDERPVRFGPFPLPRFISLAAPFFVGRPVVEDPIDSFRCFLIRRGK
jgi:hypothetical protein